MTGDALAIDGMGGAVARRAASEEAEGRAELATKLRQQCRTLIGFTEYRYARYRTSLHHKLVAEQLERVERREVDRLMIEMPPRHGKSELASISYPAWCLGRRPERQIISASAGNDLAQDWDKAVRNIVASDEFQLVYPGVSLAEDSKAAGRWRTKQGGLYIAASVGTAILGRVADEYLIDDPFGSMTDARSEVIRDGVWQWYNGTVYNRLQPGGAIIIIGHRMHEDDLQGRLIERMKAGGDADQWTIVRLPAVAEAPTPEYPEPDPLGRQPGEPPWPSDWPIKALDRIRANTVPTRNWFALYQQKPTPDEGEMFTPDRIALRGEFNTSDVVVWVRGWDLAATVDGDWTVGVLMGKTRDKKIVVANVRRLRGRPDREELRSFPNGKYDDQVDASSRAHMVLSTSSGGFESAMRR
jgi:hypothetical protein